MKLDGLKAAAERQLADHAKCGNGNHASARCVDAIALATFVRDLLGAVPWGYVSVHGAEVDIEGYRCDAEEARYIAADLLRAAEQAEAGASQAVHPGGPAGEEGKP